MSPLVPFGEGLWTMDGDRVRMLCIPFTTRMTVVALPSGDLWLHSPIAPTLPRSKALADLGPVGHLVAPNRIHSMGLAPWKEAHPSATTWVSPRFTERHPHLPADRVLQAPAPAAWAGDVDLHVFGGSSFLDEVVFFHRPSRTLIVTDLVQRHEPATESLFWRLVKGWVGVLGEHGGTSKDLLWTFGDREAARQSAEHVLAWDFDRLVVSHGRCVSTGAKDVVARAFSWASSPSTGSRASMPQP